MLDRNDCLAYLEQELLCQIADLLRVDAAVMFASPHRYLGQESPTGNTWYNFDPGTYLECAGQGVLDNHLAIGRGWGDLAILLDVRRLRVNSNENVTEGLF